MADHTIKPIAPLYRVGDETFRQVPLADAQTFREGAVIVRGSNGVYQEGGTNPAAITGIALAGAADYEWAEDTFGYTAQRVPVASPDQVFRGTLATAAATQENAVTIANVAAEIGKEYGLVKNTDTGYWVVNQADTSNARVRIVAVDDDVVDGDGNIMVHFVILPANQEAIS